jgi:Ran GTPase-activating protein (RanGAP) involved in mRNA processing and transport
VTNNHLAMKNGTLPQPWYEMLQGKNNHLRKLHLSYNRIQYPGVMKLFDHLSRNRSIVELKLDGNEMGRYTGTSHAEVVKFLSENNSVTYLSMCDMSLRDDIAVKLGEGLQRNTKLKRLLASSNEITVRAVGEIATFLAANDTLEVLDLSCRAVQTNDDMYMQAYRNLIQQTNLEQVII